jgi:RND family efflux transporter MFP subunit
MRSLILVTALSLLTACKRSPAATQEAPPAAGKPAHVRTEGARVVDAPTWLLLTGQLKGAHETDLAANVNGRVVATKVERGSKVKIGDPIALVDVRAAALNAAEAQAQAANAKAQAQAARLDCDRAKTLGASGAISKAELDRLDAQCRSSELMVSAMDARSQLAAQNVGDGIIRAPFAGSISERYVDVGTYVHADTKVVTMVDLDQLRLEVAIPETSIAFAKAGANVRFTVAGYPNREFTGSLRYVAASVRPATRDVLAEAIVEDPDNLLRSGMFASVRLQQGTTKSAAIPKPAIALRDGKPSAFVVAAGRLEQRFVQPGDEVGDGLIAINRGISEGDKVVVDPTADLSNGQAVE